LSRRAVKGNVTATPEVDCARHSLEISLMVAPSASFFPAPGKIELKPRSKFRAGRVVQRPIKVLNCATAFWTGALCNLRLLVPQHDLRRIGALTKFEAEFLSERDIRSL
jgi:hypothetical protein